VSLNVIVDQVMRRGLREMTTKSKTREPFRTRTFDMGPFLVNIDNVAEAIAKSRATPTNSPTASAPL
jgi:hypothetical protein